MITSLELFSGAGGLALGLEKSGFHTLALNEFDKNACATLRNNRPNWNVLEGDIHNIGQDDGDKVDSVTNNPAPSTMSPHTLSAPNKTSHIRACGIAELKRLIKETSVGYGVDDEGFLNEYINDVLMNNDIEKALTCFRELAKEANTVNKK